MAEEPSAAGKANVTLVADLTDGSRIVGVPSIENLTLVSSLGKIAVPFKLLALSDIHGKVSSLTSILAKVQPERPDLVVVSGDITHFATQADEVWSPTWK